MSFASETKNELAHVVPEKKCCMLAEIAGFLRLSGAVSLAGGGKFIIKLTTDNPAVARHYKQLIKDYFTVDASINVTEGSSIRKGKNYIIEIGPEQLSELILRETGVLMVREGMNYITDGIYDGIIRTKCCRKAFLRGAFIGSGTISNPEKSYHFEIDSNSPVTARDVRRLINTFDDIKAGTVRRKDEFVTYVKDSGQILDILAIMGASSSYFKFEDVRMTKEIRNEANRRSNCDQANIDKAVAAAEKQIEAIRKLDLSVLDEKLRKTAVLRMENPDASLTELGQMMDPPMKKSGVNSRLTKLMKLAEEQKSGTRTGGKKKRPAKQSGTE